MSFSFSYSNTTDDGTPACSATDGTFCSAYLNYVPPTSTLISSVTPAPTTVTSTQLNVVTTTVHTATTTVAAQAANVRRDAANRTYSGSDYSLPVVQTFDTTFINKIIDSPQTATPPGLACRALATPAKFSGWPASRISASCSVIATGIATTTVINTVAPLQTTVAVTSTSTTTVYGTLTVPGVQLASPTAIVGSLSGSPDTYDDSYYHDLPFEISAFGKSSSSMYLEINGCVSLDTGFWTWYNVPLPFSYIADTTLSGYWDDLYIYQGTQQGIYYDITGEVGSRQLEFEFYTSTYGTLTEYFHFIMTFFEDQPGVVKYRYFDISYNGLSATVGAQRYSIMYPPFPFLVILIAGSAF
ncbi:hypothetical protein KCU98_g1635, partial [Aureobasidium melanogenum]